MGTSLSFFIDLLPMFDTKFTPEFSNPGAGVLPETLGRDLWPTSWNPCPISDQNLKFSLPYIRTGQKLDTLFQTCFIISFLHVVLTNVRGNVSKFLSGKCVEERSRDKKIKRKGWMYKCQWPQQFSMPLDYILHISHTLFQIKMSKMITYIRKYHTPFPLPVPTM